jgi:hypothetical protein
MNAATLNPTATDVANTHASPAAPTPGGATPGLEPNSASADRDARGRFATGNRGGPGNPFARQTAAMHRALCAEVSKEDLAAMTRKLKEMALAGNMAALKLLFSYIVGRPQAATNPDTLDLQEWAQLRQTPALLEEMPQVVKALTPEHACLLARTTQPLISEAFLNQFATGFEKENERRNQAEARRQAKREHKAPPTEEPAAPQQPEAKPVEPQPQPPSANGDNGPDRFAYLTPEQILEEIRKERLRIEAAWCDAPAPAQAAETPTATKETEEKPVATREQPPSPIGENGPGQLLTRSVRTTTPAPSPNSGNGSGRYDHMSVDEILEEIRSGRYLLPPEEARRARQQARQQQAGTETNGHNGS